MGEPEWMSDKPFRGWQKLFNRVLKRCPTPVVFYACGTRFPCSYSDFISIRDVMPRSEFELAHAHGSEHLQHGNQDELAAVQAYNKLYNQYFLMGVMRSFPHSNESSRELDGKIEENVRQREALVVRFSEHNQTYMRKAHEHATNTMVLIKSCITKPDYAELFLKISRFIAHDVEDAEVERLLDHSETCTSAACAEGEKCKFVAMFAAHVEHCLEQHQTVDMCSLCSLIRLK